MVQWEKMWIFQWIQNWKIIPFKTIKKSIKNTQTRLEFSDWTIEAKDPEIKTGCWQWSIELQTLITFVKNNFKKKKLFHQLTSFFFVLAFLGRITLYLLSAVTIRNNFLFNYLLSRTNQLHTNTCSIALQSLKMC